MGSKGNRQWRFTPLKRHCKPKTVCRYFLLPNADVADSGTAEENINLRFFSIKGANVLLLTWFYLFFERA